MALIIIENILKIVPVSLVWRCGALLGALTYQLTPKRRKITQDNLKLVQPQLDDDAIEKLSKTVFRNSIANILCSQKTATLSEQKLKKLATIENREIIDLNRGRTREQLTQAERGRDFDRLNIPGAFLSIAVTEYSRKTNKKALPLTKSLLQPS